MRGTKRKTQNALKGGEDDESLHRSFFHVCQTYFSSIRHATFLETSHTKHKP
jgi:hypothetical protein